MINWHLTKPKKRTFPTKTMIFAIFGMVVGVVTFYTASAELYRSAEQHKKDAHAQAVILDRKAEKGAMERYRLINQEALAKAYYDGYVAAYAEIIEVASDLDYNPVYVAPERKPDQ